MDKKYFCALERVLMKHGKNQVKPVGNTNSIPPHLENQNRIVKQLREIAATGGLRAPTQGVDVRPVKQGRVLEAFQLFTLPIFQRSFLRQPGAPFTPVPLCPNKRIIILP